MVEARQVKADATVKEFQGDGDDELLRLELSDGVQQRVDAGVIVVGLALIVPDLLGDADFQEGNCGRRRGHAAKPRFDRGEGDVAEDDLAEARPEPGPPAGENACVRGCSGGGRGQVGADSRGGR